jgi:predicted transcriptional regulator
MSSQDYLKRLLSIRMRVHPTWVLAIFLITAVLVTQYPGYYPLWERILLGLLGSLLFLAFIIIIGLLTNLAAILAHIRIRNATLFIFGEVIVVPEDGLRPEHEVIIAVVTLLLYLVVAILFNGLYLVQSHISNSPFVLLLQWLAFFWYILTLLHIIPVFPLAGGRLLVAGIWKWKGKYLHVLRFSARIGFGLGICLALAGLVLILRSGGHSANGWLLIFLGWALQGAATFSLRRAALLGILKYTTAGNIMTKDLTVISPDLKLGDVVRDYVLVTGQDYFAVTEAGKLLGTLTVHDIRRIAKKRWDSTTVNMVMKTGKNLRTVSGEETTSHIVEQMDQLKVDRIPVLEGNDIIGVVTRDGIIRIVRTRARLKI